MALNKEAPGAVTLLQAVIFLQFGVSFFITVMTTVGISFGYSVASYFLMALLQVLVAIPGIVHVALQGNIWVAIYIAFQLVTSVCEIYWLIVMIADSQPAGRWVGLLILTLINVTAVVVALWFRNKTLKMPCKKKNKKEKNDKKTDEKPKLEAPSASMSDIERSKARSSKESSLSSPKNSPGKYSKKDESFSEKSSKGSLKKRKVKKPSNLPLDSRETSSSTKSIKSTVKSTETVTEN